MDTPGSGLALWECGCSRLLTSQSFSVNLVLCCCQVYEDWDCFKVNDVLELYGVLSVDPVLSILNNEER